MIRLIHSKIRHGLRLLSRQKGQSMVELAIITPILLLLLLGLAEVGSALRSYLVVVNAAREGARFGAKDEFIPNGTIVDWTQQSGNALPINMDQGDGTYELDATKATVFVTRLKQSYDPVDGYRYEIDDGVPDNPYCEGCCAGVCGEAEARASILTEEWLAEHAQQAVALDWPGGVPEVDMEFIAVEVMYDHPQITGLFYIGRYLPNPIPLHGMTIMRVGGNRIARCDAYPIAVHESTLDGKNDGDELGDMWNGFGSGNFGWLRWPEDSSANNANYLEESLENPRLSRNDYDNAEDPTDHWLNIGDYVWGNTGTVNSDGVRDALNDLLGKKIRILVWDTSEEQGSNGYYHIVGFAWVEITDFDLPSGRITATFRGMDTTCTAASSH